MQRKAKVTRIEKKYKDKRTGEERLLTIDYSKVKDRLKEFRESCPRGSIVTSHTTLTDRITFRAHIIKDKGDVASAEATGHATGRDDGSEKVFEKLETIAVGRALALLGYASDGEIASSEEMDEFLVYQEEQKEAMMLEYTERIESVTSLDELRDVWASIPVENGFKVALEAVKNAQKLKISEEIQNAKKEVSEKLGGVGTVSPGTSHGVKVKKNSRVEKGVNGKEARLL